MPFVPDSQIDARFPYDLECLLCDKVADDVMPESLIGVTNLLVRMREHLMSEHGAEQTEFSRHTQRKTEDVVSKVWTWYYIRPDGTDWLKAIPRGGLQNLPNPAVEVIFHMQDGAALLWRLTKPWDQVDLMTEVGRLGAQYDLGINFDLPAGLRDVDEIQKAHDCLWAFVMGDHPLSSGIPEEPRLELQSVKLARAALEGLCWVLRHEHNTAFQDNLDRLGWQEMSPIEAGEEP